MKKQLLAIIVLASCALLDASQQGPKNKQNQQCGKQYDEVARKVKREADRQYYRERARGSEDHTFYLTQVTAILDKSRAKHKAAMGSSWEEDKAIVDAQVEALNGARKRLQSQQYVQPLVPVGLNPGEEYWENQRNLQLDYRILATAAALESREAHQAKIDVSMTVYQDQVCRCLQEGNEEYQKEVEHASRFTAEDRAELEKIAANLKEYQKNYQKQAMASTL